MTEDRMQGKHSYGIILVTTATEAAARAIATTLLSERLAACVNLFPIQSLYIWQDQLEEAQEWQLVIKTDLELFSALEARIQTLHTYEIPEIIALPIVAGSQGYLGWLGTTCQPCG